MKLTQFNVVTIIETLQEDIDREVLTELIEEAIESSLKDSDSRICSIVVREVKCEVQSFKVSVLSTDMAQAERYIKSLKDSSKEHKKVTVISVKPSLEDF